MGKISYNFPFIPLTTMALKKMRNLDVPDAEGVSASAIQQASGTRLVIDPSQSLGDMSAADLEKLMSTDNVPGAIDNLFLLKFLIGLLGVNFCSNWIRF